MKVYFHKIYGGIWVYQFPSGLVMEAANQTDAENRAALWANKSLK
jgi:hypothetical protein